MRRNNSLSHMLLGAALTLGASQVLALQEMSDDSMSEVQGAGLAFGLDDFRFQAAPTSFIDQVGGAPGAGTSFNRGDLRWFGVALSNWSASEAAGERTTWAGTCDNGLNDMGCPISTQGIQDYANHDNPFLLRVFEYQRVGLDPAATETGGDWIGAPLDANGVSAGGVNQTVLEILGPSNSQDWRWAFWGEIQSSETDVDGNITNVLGTLRNQNLIIGKPAAYVRPPSVWGTGAPVNGFSNSVDGAVLRMFQYRGDRVLGGGTDPADKTLDETMGLMYHSRLSGDYRFSVNQATGALDADPVPQFSNEEGLYFSDVNAYLPLGQLYYQAIVLDSVHPVGGVGDGNFIIQLTRIPNDANVFNDFYSSAGASGYQRTGRNDRYYQTHGYVEWGRAFPTCGGANCMSGSGVSSARFSSDLALPTSVTLPALTVNAANFPGDLCGGNDCDQYSGTAPEVTVPVSVTAGPAAGATSREAIASGGGISFVSRNPSSTWNVVNNQNLASTGTLGGNFANFATTLAADNTVRQARTDFFETDNNCNIFGNGCDLRLIAQLPPDTATIQNRANAIANSLVTGGTNPTIAVNAINLGTARVEGLLVNHLKITTLGAGN
ncbi:hypothetical protein [Alcanivorax sp.]|uniref:hypothetical protein n=2 Tax=Alcanivorax TaxID=59753 RepID=UPI002630C9AC|nr:hypothetical protein [Alcanivorax sp.]